jgi:hypothetical protein
MSANRFALPLLNANEIAALKAQLYPLGSILSIL